MGLNMWAGMGRICAEPELKTTPSGVKVLHFTVAIDRKYTPQGEERKADFIDCVAWRERAEFIKRYFHKGSMIAIEGEIQTQNFTDKDDNKRKFVEIVCNNVSFCEKKQNSVQGVTEATDEQSSELDVSADDDFEEIIDEDDDLPF